MSANVNYVCSFSLLSKLY
uniref:Uncharacterized protein n=1 Tax=Anguilla anguilla TaxID=7936 RepID=A0A0E9XYP0_ANGAN